MSNPSGNPADLSHKLRSLPSVDRVLSEPALSAALAQWPRPRVVDAVRAELDIARALLGNGTDAAFAPADLAESAGAALNQQLQPSLRRTINATGVVIHTNLGRAPVSDAAARAMSEAAAGYSNLEYDLDAGERGSRANHLEALLQALTGAEAGIAVNNNAAALYFAMAAHCAGREVIVSRGQAVEIGGGFRIPDVLRDAGATLVEVGTTNRTRAADYAAAETEHTAAILRVHSSNFRIVGFTEEPTLAELRQVADDAGIMLIDDIGSGCLLDTRQFGLAEEPRPQDSIEAGADLVLFSGDKLLGGPQAGLIIGNRDAVDPLRSHPLMRVLRLDKAAIAGLGATLQHYLLGEAVKTVPIWRMIAAEPEQLQERAAQWRSAVGAGDIEAAESAIGGGSLPAETRPTFVWALTHSHPTNAARLLRERGIPVIARVEHDRLILDPRTVLPGEDADLIAALQELLGAPA
ncbi:MAG: L-seryl-tRNA(Sec) selenium transferase [Chloroflexota bacterium]|nr:L-seryl-tRNA(Sec) selenium transferase [Chloroflexota bacterium]